MKIFRVRVIRGGLRYVNRVNLRYKFLKSQAIKSPTPANKAKEVEWREIV